MSRMTWLSASGVRRTFASVAVVLAVAVGAGTLPLTVANAQDPACLLYTSDAADDLVSV